MAKDLERYVSLQYFQKIKADVEPYDHELYIHNLIFQEHLIELTCEGCKVSFSKTLFLELLANQSCCARMFFCLRECLVG